MKKLSEFVQSQYPEEVGLLDAIGLDGATCGTLGTAVSMLATNAVASALDVALPISVHVAQLALIAAPGMLLGKDLGPAASRMFKKIAAKHEEVMELLVRPPPHDAVGDDDFLDAGDDPLFDDAEAQLYSFGGDRRRGGSRGGGRLRGDLTVADFMRDVGIVKWPLAAMRCGRRFIFAAVDRGDLNAPPDLDSGPDLNAAGILIDLKEDNNVEEHRPSGNLMSELQEVFPNTPANDGEKTPPKAKPTAKEKEGAAPPAKHKLFV